MKDGRMIPLKRGFFNPLIRQYSDIRIIKCWEIYYSFDVEIIRGDRIHSKGRPSQ